MIDKLLAIQFSYLILLFTLSIKYLVSAWSHPAIIFGLFWWIMTFFPMVIMLDVPIDPWGTAYILAAVAAFAAPSLFFEWLPLQQVAQARTASALVQQPNTLRSLFYAMQLTTISFVIINVWIQGFSIVDFILHPIQSASEYLKMRYAAEIVLNPVGRLGVVLNYIAVSIAGLIITCQTRTMHAVAIILLSFVPSLLHMLVYADKGTLFLAIAYFYGALMVAWTSNGNTAIVTRMSLAITGVGLIVLIPALILTMLARGSMSDNADQQVQKVVFYIGSYAFAHIYAFSDWFSHYFFEATTLHYQDDPAPTGGFWTFMALGKLISPDRVVPPGYFAEMFEYENLLRTNIYTMFRGLIYDFTLPGSLAFLFGAGLVSSLAYRQMLLYRHAAISQSFYIFVVGFIYSSFLLSLTTWFSVYAVAMSVTLILLFFNKPEAVRLGQGSHIGASV